MGGGSWTASDWKTFSATHIDTSTTTAGMFTSSRLKENLNPLSFSVREARNSTEHPRSTPIIIALDVTGSMGPILDVTARTLNDLILNLYQRKPVTDPQIAFMAIGDMRYDAAPVQMTQFESDIRIAEQMTDIYYERGGGANSSESYIAAWFMAAHRVSADAFTEGRKGILITLGDELCPPSLSPSEIQSFVGGQFDSNRLTAKTLLEDASKNWEVFHLIMEEGNYCAHPTRKEECISKWQNLLGQRAVVVSDYNKLPEIIISIMEVLAGKDTETIVSSWDGSTALAVKKAIGNLKATRVEQDIVRF